MYIHMVEIHTCRQNTFISEIVWIQIPASQLPRTTQNNTCRVNSPNVTGLQDCNNTKCHLLPPAWCHSLLVETNTWRTSLPTISIQVEQKDPYKSQHLFYTPECQGVNYNQLPSSSKSSDLDPVYQDRLKVSALLLLDRSHSVCELQEKLRFLLSHPFFN